MKKDVVKLACSAALSGVEMLHGEAEVKAVQLAVDMANEKNLPFRLELVYGDDGADAAMSETLANRFCQDEQILGVVGPMGSNAAIAGAPVYNRNRMVCITHSASVVEVAQKGYDTFFRMIANDEIHSETLVRFVKEKLDVHDLVIFNDNTAFAVGLADLFEQKSNEYHIEVKDRVETCHDYEDLTEQVCRVKNADPSLVFFAGMEPECQRMALELRIAGLECLYLGTDAIKPSKYLLTPGYDHIEGPYQSNACIDLAIHKPAADFAARYERKYGETYSVYTAEAFDAANVIIEAMIRSNETPTRESVLHHVRKMQQFPGITGKITFDRKGERLSPLIGFYRFDGDAPVFIGYSEEIFT